VEIAGAIIGNGDINQGSSVESGNTAPVRTRPIATDGAIDECQSAATRNTAAGEGGARPIATDRTVRDVERDITCNTTTRATAEKAVAGEVVANRAVRNGQRADAKDPTAPTTTPLVPLPLPVQLPLTLLLLKLTVPLL